MLGLAAFTRRGRAAASFSTVPATVEPAPRPTRYPDPITREIAQQQAASWIAHEAETIPGVRKALHVIVGTISTLQLAAWRGDQRLPDSAYPWLRQPDPTRTSQSLLSATIRDLVWHDRCVWRAQGSGAFQRVDPGTVAPLPPTDRNDVPSTWLIDGIATPASSLVVFDGAGLGGLRRLGAPLLDMYLRLMAAATRNADDPVPLTVLKNTGTEELAETEIDGLLDGWEEARRARTVAYAGRYLDVMTPGYSPRDLQLAEVTEAVTKDVARLFGLPGFYVGVDDGGSMTYGNVVDRRRDLLEALAPWTSVITQTLSMDELRYTLTVNGVAAVRAGRWLPYGTVARFDVTSYERDAFRDRIATLTQAISANGVRADGTSGPLMYVDEARALEPLITAPTTTAAAPEPTPGATT